MRNTSDDTKRSTARAARSGRGQTIVALLVLVGVGSGAFVLWEKYGGFVASSAMDSSQTFTASEASDATTQAVKDLQASQQQMADKIDGVMRQLAAEQGERKLLSEQVAALSGRVSGISGSNASVRASGIAGANASITTGMAAAKRKPKPPEALPAAANR
jgi:uncharacterized protein HemX